MTPDATAGDGRTGIASIVLAAGRGTRFEAEEGSKLTALHGDVPLVRRVVETASIVAATPVIVVVGHAEATIGSALAGLDVTFARNGDFASGMASSLKTGLREVPEGCSGVLVLLADMPLVQPKTLVALIDCFVETPNADAIVPTLDGVQGNPVLIARKIFRDLLVLEGDMGARAVLKQSGRYVVERSVSDPGILQDVDTRDALRALDLQRG